MWHVTWQADAAGTCSQLSDLSMTEVHAPRDSASKGRRSQEAKLLLGCCLGASHIATAQLPTPHRPAGQEGPPTPPLPLARSLAAEHLAPPEAAPKAPAKGGAAQPAARGGLPQEVAVELKAAAEGCEAAMATLGSADSATGTC